MSELRGSDATGEQILAFAKRLFPITRSITGEGVRQTLQMIQQEVPGLTLREVPSGTKCFDWTVPQEWQISEAYIEDPSGKRIVDFKNHNLHVVSYSTPVDETLELDELQKHL
ncbi:MAG: hypothetical protein RIR54_234, partial [Actinomycetota bacterium]